VKEKRNKTGRQHERAGIVQREIENETNIGVIVLIQIEIKLSGAKGS
jgi:hypothetical protein